ncbi:MAG: ribose-phosphate diphosphokinase, partial [Phycisphaerae bacterium]|nr:ribose-phosphate diphosphokinase [Phycisphaerae bacterium]
CKDQGAKAVYVGATHAILCGPAIERLREAPIDDLVVTDTIPISQEKVAALDKLHVLSVAELVGEAIHRIHNDESVSSLFHMDNGRA